MCELYVYCNKHKVHTLLYIQFKFKLILYTLPVGGLLTHIASYSTHGLHVPTNP